MKLSNKFSTLIVTTLLTFAAATNVHAETRLIRSVLSNGAHHKVRPHHGNRNHQKYQGNWHRGRNFRHRRVQNNHRQHPQHRRVQNNHRQHPQHQHHTIQHHDRSADDNYKGY